MTTTTQTPERIKFIPERSTGEPAGERLEGEVIYTSDNKHQKLVRTDNHSVHLISDIDGPGKEKGEWETIQTVFDIEEIKMHISRASQLMDLLYKMRNMAD